MICGESVINRPRDKVTLRYVFYSVDSKRATTKNDGKLYINGKLLESTIHVQAVPVFDDILDTFQHIGKRLR